MGTILTERAPIGAKIVLSDRLLVDVTERVGRVKNEGLNLSGTIRVLQLAARAATDLALDKDFAARCRRVADGLLVTLDRLYNGHYFMAAEGDPQLNLSSLAPIYPMLIVPPDDPRAISTARAYLRREQRPPMGQGPDRAAAANVTSPWSAGVLATVFAMQGDGESAWETLCAAAPSVCEFGGMSEYILDGGRWNMQYFGTAQAAVCTAVHALLLQARDSRLLLFPAIPPAWPACSFANLLAGGCEVSGRFDRAAGQARAEIMNRSVEPLTTTVCYGRQSLELDLRPGERRTLTWAIA